MLHHQRAELGRADTLRAWSLVLQFAVALLAAISVLFNDGPRLLALAAFGVVILAVWLVCDGYYRRHRSAGDQARRLLLVISGLGENVGEVTVMQSAFTATGAKLNPMSIDAYFASTAVPGPPRLAEMLDESSFFTADLQRRSGETMLLTLFFAMVAVLVSWLVFGPRLHDSSRIVAARVLLAFGVFLLSSDVLGAAFGHLRAASAMESIRLRISAARGRGYPMGDVLQSMADYNAAVESAPLPLPGLYARRRIRLDKAWAEYKQETGIGVSREPLQTLTG